jgi:branched-chain amino acid aminotransferase
MQRFIDSAHICQIDVPYSLDELCDAVTTTLKENSFQEAYIRPLLFLGEGSMGLFPKDNPPKISVIAWIWGTYLGKDGLKNGIRVKISSFVRWHANSCLSKAKITGSYVISQLAKKEVLADGYDEALLLDVDGYVAEGAGENIFIIKDGQVKTTPPGSILPGITRNSAIEIMRREGVPCVEERFTRDELYLADGAFFTGTAAEITPISEVDRRKIGTGKPDPITKKIQDIFFDIVHGRRRDYSDWLSRY